MIKYDAGIFEAILQMLVHLCGCTSIEFEKTEADGVFDYWDYKVIAKKANSKEGVEFTVRFSGEANQQEYTVSELERMYKKNDYFADVVDVATTLLASKKYRWLPHG